MAKANTLRANSDELHMIYELGAAVQTLHNALQYMTRRLELIGETTELAHVASEAKEIYIGIVESLPEPKRDVVKAMLPGLKWGIYWDQPASRGKDVTQVITDDLYAVVKEAHESCALCTMPTGCRRCSLGRAMDRVLVLDRDGASWQDIDMEAWTEMQDNDGG